MRAAVFARELLEGRLHRRVVGEVGLDEREIGARIREVEADDAVAIGQRPGQRAPDVAGRAGDDDERFVAVSGCGHVHHRLAARAVPAGCAATPAINRPIAAPM